MINRQQRDALWTLVPGQAIRLSAGPSLRQLRVLEGVLWLTTRGRWGLPAEDIWLQPGETIDLPAGSEWVVEARDAGRFKLLPQPLPAPRARVGRWLWTLRLIVPRALRA